ncbi:MAG: hypothetical protein Q8M94_22445 [Ignavibacteria bacterium]|nr:hypothetical protein [Ignavibacteria bacterium]
MAETYDIRLAITVIKSSDKEAIVDEETYFNSQSFARLANLADEFYELIAKLQKIK